MAVGFLAGDFIAALDLVGMVVTSLRESNGATSQLRELLQELFSLERALLHVKQLEFDESQVAEYHALRQAACQCQYTIDQFQMRTSRYQKQLLSDPHNARTKSAWTKVQWTLFKTDELLRFKADIAAHTQSILILLTAFQMKKAEADRKSDKASLKSFRALLHSALTECLEKLALVSRAVTSSVTQTQEVLQHTAKIFQTNLRIYQVVCAIQNAVTHLPVQVDRQQPVSMIDALGKVSPFHLEFIRSAAALRAVLNVNFEKIPSGRRKIENGEFVIYDSANGREVDLSQDWDICFYPGQKIDMRMIFRKRSRKADICPACRSACHSPPTRYSDTRCPSCSLIFGRVLEIKDIPSVPATEYHRISDVSPATAMESRASDEGTRQMRIPPETAFDESEDIRHYRRIRVLSWKRRKVELHPEIHSQVEESTFPVPEGSSFAVDSIPESDNLYNVDMIESVVDMDVFEQILEMDEDDLIEREFSREIVKGFFETVGNTIEEVRPHIYSDSPDLESIYMAFYFCKGSCATLGLSKLHRLTELVTIEIRRPRAASGDEPIEDVRENVKGLFEQFEHELGHAKETLFKFYRIKTTGQCD